jgi:hypothetical protein
MAELKKPYAGILGFGLIILLLAGILSVWFYKLQLFPGLHGDEAVFGLRACDFNEKGIDKPYALNYYTGILFSWVLSLVFKVLGPGVFQMRLAAVALNLIALFIICLLLFKGQVRTLVLFLVLLGQSALYLLYPRIAWEITAFNFLFLAMMIFVSVKLLKATRLRILWLFLFFFISLTGSYNHFIFTSIPLAASIGCILLAFYNKRPEYVKNILPSLMNIINLVLYYLLIKYAIDKAWQMLGAWIPFMVLAVMVFQAIWCTRDDFGFVYRIIAKSEIIKPRLILRILFGIAIVVFLRYHGIALLQTFSNNVVFLRLFSFAPPLLVSISLYICGTIILLYFIINLVKDLFIVKHGELSEAMSVMVVVFLAVFTFIISRNAIRYYLLVSMVIFLYTAFKLSKERVSSPLFIVPLVALTVSLLVTQILVWNIYTSPDRRVNAVHFKFGNHIVETSAHFLPTEPLYDILSKDKISTIETTAEDSYFIEKPVAFYKRSQPWQEIQGKSVFISYDYQTKGTGFMISPKSQ